jgi:hypothetical protein
MKTEYTILTKFRNKEQFDILFSWLQAKGKTCYNLFAIPADPKNPAGDIKEQMDVFESNTDFFNDAHFRMMFEQDLQWLKNAEKVIVLLPAWVSVHIEAGIAYGLWKKLILIGAPEKPESLYLIFNERHDTIKAFLDTL